ncbi:MAG: penicillin-binding transpeptidase domain-containing protein [Planctomycetota bacterium]|jgi:penicillin-binding protein 2
MEGIDELKLQQGISRQLQTIRGQILDRKGKILATNEPQFQLHINYKLTCLFDERVRMAKLLTAAKSSMLAKEKPSLHKVRKEMEAKLEDLNKIIYKCSFFGQGQLDIEEEINYINNRIWNLRTFLAWRRNDPDPKIIAKYGRVSNVPLSVAIEDFEKKFPDEDDRLLQIEKIKNIPKMNRGWRLLELKTDADVFDAQLEFMDIEGMEILPKESRSYPYGSVAAQTIGWVGPPQERDKRLFANDRLSRYISDEVCGREDGVEYICETILRGRRGEELWDIDRQRVSRTETQFGKNVTITLDIELQKKIEEHLADCILNPNCQAPIAAVVIDVNTGDILALVSTPTFDLNLVRQDYGDLASDSNEPLRNRAINKGYPPGSVIKPLILIAGLQSRKITAGEPINCLAVKAPRGWPNCLIFSRHRSGHDYKWQNNARNAVRGSCNIYFSRLADRIDPPVLQLWLFKFGYAQKIPITPPNLASSIENRASGIENRNLRQVAGTISSTVVKTPISRLDQIPPLYKGERRYFGIGQGNLRVTPLQVANAMAAIARGGIYKPPRLFLDSEPSSSENREPGINLNISPQTIAVVHDGMSAVVNELGGTAYTPFIQSTLIQQGVNVYGKTGSTQAPETAWFAGFATDNAGRSIAIAILVEGGQSGSQDAAPLGRDIIQFCVDTENLGPHQSAIE